MDKFNIWHCSSSYGIDVTFGKILQMLGQVFFKQAIVFLSIVYQVSLHLNVERWGRML